MKIRVVHVSNNLTNNSVEEIKRRRPNLQTFQAFVKILTFMSHNNHLNKLL